MNVSEKYSDSDDVKIRHSLWPMPQLKLMSITVYPQLMLTINEVFIVRKSVSDDVILFSNRNMKLISR